LSGRFGFAELIGAASDLVESIEQRTLIVNQQFGIAYDVDEKDVRQLQLDFLFDLSRHVARQINNKDKASI
jgi:hypothetical protein